MIVFTNTISPRLTYILDFIGKEIMGNSFSVTDNENEFINYPGPQINYSNKKLAENEFQIQPYTLLFEKEIKQQELDCFEINSYTAFFKTTGDFPFDIFASSFYLLSRYEEYLPNEKDMYGRYAHENSLAFKENFLKVPLVNIWLQDFKNELSKKFSQFAIHN